MMMRASMMMMRAALEKLEERLVRRGGKQGINCMKTSSTSPAVCARAAELVELGMCR